MQLRRLGVHLLLDGVGSGFSSLALLKQLPLDAIKIGREFVTKLRPADSGGEDLAAREVVNALVGLGRDLGVEIVAEGVETVAQYELVKAAGATQVQGYLFSNALSVEKATNLLLSLDSES